MLSTRGAFESSGFITLSLSEVVTAARDCALRASAASKPRSATPPANSPSWFLEAAKPTVSSALLTYQDAELEALVPAWEMIVSNRQPSRIPSNEVGRQFTEYVHAI